MFWLVVFFMGLFIPASIAFSQNLVGDLSLWVPAEGMSISEIMDSKLGIKVLKVSGSQDGEWNYASIGLSNRQVASRTKYLLEGWMRVEFLSNPSFSPRFKLGVRDSYGNYLKGYYTRKYDTSAMNTWQRIWGEFELAPQADTGYVTINKPTVPMTAVMYVHGISLTKIEAFSPVERLTFRTVPTGLSNLAEKRPRLYFDKTKMELIKSKLTTYPYSKFWAYVKEKADRYSNEIPPPSTDGIPGKQNQGIRQQTPLPGYGISDNGKRSISY